MSVRSRIKKLNPDRNLRAYVIGLALGDGNLSLPSPRATRLRITCDKNYPALLQRIKQSVQFLFEENKVSLIERKNCVDVSVYSQQLETFLGWRVGKKNLQGVTVPAWIKKNRKYTISCLRGLLETDGSVYTDRGYKMVIFVNTVSQLAGDVHQMIRMLGFKPHLYKFLRNDQWAYKHVKYRYHVRLSKDTERFISLIRLRKN